MEDFIVSNVKGAASETNSTKKDVLKTDSGIQTDTHFVESYIDKTYEWNEWVLRKKALQLADLCGKATHSSQTTCSNWRKEGGAQTSVSRNGETQTTKEQSTTTPIFPTFDQPE